MRSLIVILLSSGLISACSTLEEDRVQYESFSCNQLAEETGRWKQVLEDAEGEELGSDIASVLIDDKKDKQAAEMDSVIAGMNAGDAKDHLSELQRIADAKGCK